MLRKANGAGQKQCKNAETHLLFPTSSTDVSIPPATFETTAPRGYPRHHLETNADTHELSHRCDVRSQRAGTAGSQTG